MVEKIVYRKQYLRAYVDSEGNIIHIATNDNPFTEEPIKITKKDNTTALYTKKDIEFERPFIDGGLMFINGIKVRVDKGHIRATDFFIKDEEGNIIDSHLECKDEVLSIKDSAPAELKDKIKNLKNIEEK